jgi:hypothetical protein
LPTDDRLAALTFSPAEIAMLLEAGRDIQNAIEPSKALSDAQKALLPGIQKQVTAALCPPPTAPTCQDVEVARCFDRAAKIILWRRKERDHVDRKLFTAAMGVSVTGREYPSYPNLVKFCTEMAALDGQKP